MFNLIIYATLAIFVIILANKYLRTKNVEKKKRISTLIVLGSGGHTTEMLSFMYTLDISKFSPRNYIVAQSEMGKHDSRNKATQFEANYDNKEFKIHNIPRAREVGQSYFTSVFTTLLALFKSMLLVAQIQPDLVLTNGPGTCVPICVSAFLLRITGIKDIKIVFSESFACVDHISLSGKILYPLADIFFVQWQQLQHLYPNSIYSGRLSNDNNKNIDRDTVNINKFGSVFITVGSTSFDKLIKEVDNIDFIKKLKELGFNKLTIQIGRGKYTPQLTSNDLQNFAVEYYQFKESLKEDILNASLIISHAGAGSILEVLGLNKPLIVIPNEDLMNNHQVQLAKALSDSKFLLYSNVTSLSENITELTLSFDKNPMLIFPKTESKLFSTHVNKLVNI